MARPHTEVEVPSLPLCDICRYPVIGQGVETVARYDGKTTMGPWANMCERHFRSVGVGLGLGKGQKLILRVPSEAHKKV